MTLINSILSILSIFNEYSKISITRQSLEQVKQRLSLVLALAYRNRRAPMLHRQVVILTSVYPLSVRLPKVPLSLHMAIFHRPSSPPRHHTQTRQRATLLQLNNGYRIQDHKALLDDLCFLIGTHFRF